MIKQITPEIWQLHFKGFGSCVYLIGKDTLVDTSSRWDREKLISDLAELKVKPEDIKSIIITHPHYDHIENINAFPKAKVYSHKNIDELKKVFPNFQTIETPGHTGEDICILYRDVLFSGDVIFDKNHNYVGRTDLPESNPEKMKESLEKLKKLKYVKLCPGHLV